MTNETATFVDEDHDEVSCHFCTEVIQRDEPMYEAAWHPTGELRWYHADCYEPDEPFEPDGVTTVPGFGSIVC